MSETILLILCLVLFVSYALSVILVIRTYWKLDEIYFAFQQVLGENKRLRKKKNGSKKQIKK